MIYFIHLSSALFGEIYKMKIKETILQDLRKEFTDLYQDRLDCLCLFGSYARGTADPDSDIDVLVVLKDQVDPNLERKRTLNLVTDLSLENNIVIACLFVDANTFAHKQDSLYRNIRREGVRF